MGRNRAAYRKEKREEEGDPPAGEDRDQGEDPLEDGAGLPAEDAEDLPEVILVAELGRITPLKREPDVGAAKEMLDKAKKALLRGKYFSAIKMAQESRKLAKAAEAYHRKVINDLHSLTDFIEYIGELGYDTAKAQEVADEAKKAVLRLEYPHSSLET